MAARQGALWSLDHVEYEDGLLLMQWMAEARRADDAEDSLFLLEHPHTITMGRRAKAENILLDPHQAHAQRVGIFETGRGGDVTYHGPGQLVGYPIVNLKPDRCDVHRYVRDLEEVILRTLAHYGIVGTRDPGFTGVWVGNDKVAAIGVRIARWITTHGFALNISTDLDAFGWIVPCGLQDRGVTSLAKLLGTTPPRQEVEAQLRRHFCDVFDIVLQDRAPQEHSIQVILTRRRATGWEALALRRVPSRGGFWQPVTGHIEAGEQAIDAAAREVLEETGLEGVPVDLDYVHQLMIDPQWAPEASKPLIYEEKSFMMEVSGDLHLDPTSHDAFRWLPLAEAQKMMRWKGNQRAVELTQRRLNSPLY